MDFNVARHNMVEGQIRPNRVTDPLVVEAMETVPREAFVPKALKTVAYVDEALKVAKGRYMMEPMVLSRLLQGAAVQAEDVALVVGCATGYTAAVLARMASTVVALENDKALADKANGVLSDLGIDNVAVVEGALTKGYAKQAPYDVIVLDGAVQTIPAAITNQLGDGGRLVAVVAEPGMVGRAVVVTRVDGSLSQRDLFDAGIPPLPDFASEAKFKL